VDEDELFRLAKAGNGRALGALIQPRYGGLVRAAQEIVKNEEVALEIAQESCARIMQYLPQLETAADFGVLLTTINLNRARNAYDFGQDKKRPRIPADKLDLLPNRDPTAEESAITGELMERLKAASAKLDPRKRRAFELRHVEGKMPQEIAKEMGLRPTQVYELLREARNELAAMLDPAGSRDIRREPQERERP